MNYIQVQETDRRGQELVSEYCLKRGYREPSGEVSLTAAALNGELDLIKTLIERICHDEALNDAERDSLANVIGSRSLALKRLKAKQK